MVISCSYCGKDNFRSKHDCMRHERVHTGEKPYKCEYEGCEKSFAEKHPLIEHTRIHTGEKPYICEYEGCKKAFARAETLKTHILVHTGERPLKCPYKICTKRFIKSGALKIHIRAHTGVNPYVCEYEACGKSYPSASSLRNHIVMKHEKIRNYRCDIGDCGKEFYLCRDLKNHKETHFEREKKYKCSFDRCGKGFSSEKYLVIHERTHTGEKPFGCSVEGCDKTFVSGSGLWQHMKTEHGKCQNPKEDCKLGVPSPTFDYQYCYPCGCILTGRTQLQRRQDRVFQEVRTKLQDYEDVLAIYFDKEDPNNNTSTKARADIRIVTLYRTIIVEVDEQQHDNEKYASCVRAKISNLLANEITESTSENRERLLDRADRLAKNEDQRMSELSNASEVKNLVFIRFNPDTWKDDKNVTRRRKKEIPQERIDVLLEEIYSWLDIDKVQNHLAEVVYLYYDGPMKTTDYIPLDPSELEVGDKRVEIKRVLDDSLEDINCSEEDIVFQSNKKLKQYSGVCVQTQSLIRFGSLLKSTIR